MQRWNELIVMKMKEKKIGIAKLCSQWVNELATDYFELFFTHFFYLSLFLTLFRFLSFFFTISFCFYFLLLILLFALNNHPNRVRCTHTHNSNFPTEIIEKLREHFLWPTGMYIPIFGSYRIEWMSTNHTKQKTQFFFSFFLVCEIFSLFVWVFFLWLKPLMFYDVPGKIRSSWCWCWWWRTDLTHTNKSFSLTIFFSSIFSSFFCSLSQISTWFTHVNAFYLH